MEIAVHVQSRSVKPPIRTYIFDSLRGFYFDEFLSGCQMVVPLRSMLLKGKKPSMTETYLDSDA